MLPERALLPFNIPLPTQLWLIIGQHAATQKMLELVATLSLKHSVTLLDCGNRSNMYTVAKLIRPYTTDPVGVLNNIRLSRAFTCYQALAMLESVAAGLPREPVVVLDLLATFLDEDVELKDSQRLLTRSILCLKQLSQLAPVLVSTRPIPPIAENRACLLEQLRVSADAAWEEPLALPAGYGLQPHLFA